MNRTARPATRSTTTTGFGGLAALRATLPSGGAEAPVAAPVEVEALVAPAVEAPVEVPAVEAAPVEASAAWVAAEEAVVDVSAAYCVARDARDAAKAAWVRAQAAHPKGHPERVALAAVYRAADTAFEAAREALRAAEMAATVAGQALREVGQYAEAYYDALAGYAREYQLARAFAAAEKAVALGGMDWCNASDEVRRVARDARLTQGELAALWAEAAPLSAAQREADRARNAAQEHAEWLRRQPVGSDVGWLRG